MSRFSQLMQRGQRKVNYRDRQGKLLMTMSDDQHKAIARLIQHWLKENSEPVKPASTVRRKKAQ